MRKLPPTLKLDELISDPDLHPALEGLEIDASDTTDFLKCFRILELQMEGMTLKDACSEVGVLPQQFHKSRWQGLANLARRVLTAKVMVSVDNLANRVYERMPEMIDSMINVALNGGKDHEKVAAMELLWKMYPNVAGSKEEMGEKPQSDYLKKPKNFNPMTPVINIQPGATITITNQSQDVIDVTPSETDNHGDN